MSTPEEIRDLLGAWALDAVDDDERAAVEHAIAADPALAAEARELREQAAALAASAATAPPPALRDAVLAAIALEPRTSSVAPALLGPDEPRASGSTTAPATGSTSAPDGAPSSAAPSPPVELVRATPARPRRSPWRTFSLAAAVAAAIAIPTTVAVQQTQRAEQAELQATSISEALARPGAQLVSSEVAGGGTAVAVMSPEGALLTASGLPTLDDDLAYQLWMVDGEEITSGGMLTVRDGRVTLGDVPVPDGTAMAISVEPAGGSMQPTTDPVVVLAPA